MKDFELPDWIDEDAWEGYVEMRKQTKRELKTNRAKMLAVCKLQKLMSKGQDPNEVLDQSTFRSWQGLFAVHQEVTREDIAMGGGDFMENHFNRDWAPKVIDGGKK